VQVIICIINVITGVEVNWYDFIKIQSDHGQFWVFWQCSQMVTSGWTVKTWSNLFTIQLCCDLKFNYFYESFIMHSNSTVISIVSEIVIYFFNHFEQVCLCNSLPPEIWIGLLLLWRKNINACFVNYERTSGCIGAQALYYLKLDYLHSSYCSVTDWGLSFYSEIAWTFHK